MQTVPDPSDEPAWKALADWLGATTWERLSHSLMVQTPDGLKRAWPGDCLYRDRDGRVEVIFAGALERVHAPPSEPEAWDITITVAHAHGDASLSIGTILGAADGRIDARALAREIESFVGAASRPADISVSIELRTRNPRGVNAMPSLDELKTRAGEAITLKL